MRQATRRQEGRERREPNEMFTWSPLKNNFKQLEEIWLL